MVLNLILNGNLLYLGGRNHGNEKTLFVLNLILNGNLLYTEYTIEELRAKEF